MLNILVAPVNTVKDEITSPLSPHTLAADTHSRVICRFSVQRAVFHFSLCRHIAAAALVATLSAPIYAYSKSSHKLQKSIYILFFF